MNLEACLPANLRGPATTITKIAMGLSGAGVYRVDVSEQVFVLKVSPEQEPVDEWRQKIHVQQLAAASGLAPRVTHTDEAHRAVLSDFVVDLSFPALYGNPATRESALALLGRTLRRVHELPMSPGVQAKNGRDFLSATWATFDEKFSLPAFTADTVRRVLAEDVPASGRPLVLSHNDVNPTNLVYDGEHLVLLDWETAGLNDPFYDLAAIAVFLRLDATTSRQLLEAHDGAPVNELPARFIYDRRLVAALCGTTFLRMARQGGHAGATGEETIDSTLSLGDFYQRMRAGSLSGATPEGQWHFGLALVKECLASYE